MILGDHPGRLQVGHFFEIEFGSLPKIVFSRSVSFQELCITVRRGSTALRRPGGAREAYDEYRRALQQVAKHPKELNLSGNELISLRSAPHLLAAGTGISCTRPRRTRGVDSGDPLCGRASMSGGGGEDSVCMILCALFDRYSISLLCGSGGCMRDCLAGYSLGLFVTCVALYSAVTQC